MKHNGLLPGSDVLKHENSVEAQKIMGFLTGNYSYTS